MLQFRSPAAVLFIYHLSLILPPFSLQWRPKLINRYRDKTNFNLVRLACARDDDSFETPLKNVTFMWNNSTDVEEMEEMRAKSDGESMTVLLDQQREGLFTCLSDGQSSDAVPLAGMLIDAIITKTITNTLG